MSQPERYPAAMPLTSAYMTLSFCAGRRAGTEVMVSVRQCVRCATRNASRSPQNDEEYPAPFAFTSSGNRP